MAAENFRSLCACDKGNGKVSGKPLCFKGTKFHRISKESLSEMVTVSGCSCTHVLSLYLSHSVPNFMIQGGDLSGLNGTGGESIYGGYYDDERSEVCGLYLIRCFLCSRCPPLILFDNL